MPNTIETRKLVHPLMWWTDLGLRAVESTIATTQNWMSAVGNFVSAGAGAELAPHAADAVSSQDAVHEHTQAAWGERPAARKSDSPARAPRRSGGRNVTLAQHAMASSEPTPRRKAAAKARRTQRASRK